MKTNKLRGWITASLLLATATLSPLKATEIVPLNNNLTCENTPTAALSYYAGSWEAAKEEARRTGKGLFVKMWATWCVNCRVMDDNVFNDPKVAGFYNENFVNYSLDYDSEVGQEFAQIHNVQFLPDFFFFDSNANLVLRATEGKTQTQMLDFAHQALGNTPKTLVSVQKNTKLYTSQQTPVSTKHIGTYEENLKIYEMGYEKKPFLRNFAVQSKQIGREYEAVANKYIKKIRWGKVDWNSPENQQFLFEFANAPQLKSINYVVKHKESLVETYGRYNVESRFKTGVRNEIIEASLDKQKSTLRKSLKLTKKAKLQDSKAFKHEIKLTYFENAHNWKSYAQEINHYANNFDGLDPVKLNIAAWNIHNNTDSKRLLRQAAKWCEQSMSISTMYYNQETYAHILYKMGKEKKARLAVLRALVLARREGKVNTRADILAQELDAK